jgi:hypothetical protein
VARLGSVAKAVCARFLSSPLAASRAPVLPHLDCTPSFRREHARAGERSSPGDTLTQLGSRRSRRTSPPIPPARSSRLPPSRTRAEPKRQPRGEGRPTEKPCTPRPFPFDRGRRDNQPRPARRVVLARRPTRSIRRLTPHRRATRSPSTRSDQPAKWVPSPSRDTAHMTDHGRQRVDRRSMTHAPVNHRER